MLEAEETIQDLEAQISVLKHKNAKLETELMQYRGGARLIEFHRQAAIHCYQARLHWMMDRTDAAIFGTADIHCSMAQQAFEDADALMVEAVRRDLMRQAEGN
jgi:hypothetical protein